jgi:DNA primase
VFSIGLAVQFLYELADLAILATRGINMLLELAKELGLNPKRTSSTHGGEYHSPCPRCGGNDRFFVQPRRKMRNCLGYYRCRQCEAGGDTIQFCMDFMGLTYFQACEKLGQKPNEGFNPSFFFEKPSFMPCKTTIPSIEWQTRALDFVNTAHLCAVSNSFALNALNDRGLTLETIKKYRLGWNEINRFDAPNLWGIHENDARDRWLPQGIVIPTYFGDQVMKLKIRRATITQGDIRKYIIVGGGRNSPSFFGDLHLPIIILESELDAILVQQIAGDLCSCISIPAGNKPDVWADQILRSAPKLIFSMDFDDAGKNTFAFWKSTYPQIKPWPVPQGKSPGDAYKLKVNLRDWLIVGVR